MIKDYYSILGVEISDTREVIISKFRELAKIYHPDKDDSKKSTEMFKEIYEAYDILKDEIKRKEYDILYEKYIVKKREYDRSQFSQINSWVNISSNNFEKFIRLDFKEFLKVTLEKSTYQGLKSLKFGLKTVFFMITLIYTFLSFVVTLSFFGHLSDGSINTQIVMTFVLIISIHLVLILTTRRLILSYKKQYGG